MGQGVACEHTLQLQSVINNGQSCVGGLVHETYRLVHLQWLDLAKPKYYFWIECLDCISWACSLLSNNFIIGNALKRNSIVDSKNSSNMKSSYAMLRKINNRDAYRQYQ